MKREFEDGLVMLAELTVKPDKLAEFLDYTIANLAVSRSYPGNRRFDILVSEIEPCKVTFYEVWASPEAQQAYMAWRVQVGDLTKLLSLLACEPRFSALRSISA
jgi:quinol monooxygenase YgiN